MIQKLNDITAHLAWMDALISDECFSSPFRDRESIISVSKKGDTLLLGSFDGQQVTGVFGLLVSEEEKYIETLFLCAKEESVYQSLLSYLQMEYAGFDVWFVFNPKNALLHSILSAQNAFFYTAQNCMEYQGTEIDDISEIIPYSDCYKQAYIQIHTTDGYWNGERVLDQMDDFNVFLCIKDQKLVGYIDCGKGKQKNEIMDLFVAPQYRNQGIGTLLLKKAIFTDRHLILTVDIDNAPAIHLYEKTGFVEMPQNNSITAKLQTLPT